MKFGWEFWLGLYLGLRICVEACEKCKSPEWQEKIEKLLDRCERELDLEGLAKSLVDELLSGL